MELHDQNDTMKWNLMTFHKCYLVRQQNKHRKHNQCHMVMPCILASHYVFRHSTIFRHLAISFYSQKKGREPSNHNRGRNKGKWHIYDDCSDSKETGRKCISVHIVTKLNNATAQSGTMKFFCCNNYSLTICDRVSNKSRYHLWLNSSEKKVHWMEIEGLPLNLKRIY